MDKVANLSFGNRSNLFSEAAAQKGIAPKIIEKDFWVCWTLHHIFKIEEIRDHIIFKGGTSLSKIFKVIERFSEDIDLVLDWRVLGYGRSENSKNPENERSRTQQDRFNQEMNAVSRDYIKNHLVQILSSHFAQHIDQDLFDLNIDSEDPDSILFRYPATQEDSRYIKPEVKLEIGPLASRMPNAVFQIQPYAQEYFPQFFSDPCRVVAITAERTFWEKITILHQQANRGEASPWPPRYSRHYYDIFRMLFTDIKRNALEQIGLLHDVIAFKSKYYPCTWAQYDEAVPGTLKLLPNPKHLKELAQDYERMKIMIFGEIPEFEIVMELVGQLENEINSLGE